MRCRWNIPRSALTAVLVSCVTLVGCSTHSTPTALPSNAASALTTPSTTLSSVAAPSQTAVASGNASDVGSTPATSAADSPTSSSAAVTSASESPELDPTSAPIEGPSALRSAFPQVTAQIPAAIKIVRDYFDGINTEIDTGSENAVSAVIQSSCAYCINQIVNIKALLVNGDSIRGGHVHLLSVNDAYPSYSNIVNVEVNATADAISQIDPRGKIVSTGAATPLTKMVFAVVIDQPHFVIGELAWLGT